MPGQPVTLRKLAEDLGCDVDWLHQQRRKRDHPLPAHLLTGRTRPYFTSYEEFWEWQLEEERRKEWSTEAKGANFDSKT